MLQRCLSAAPRRAQSLSSAGQCVEHPHLMRVRMGPDSQHHSVLPHCTGAKIKATLEFHNWVHAEI